MNDRTFEIAKRWGFVCDFDIHGKYQIFPHRADEKWELQLVDERWLLVVGDVPQVFCYPSEAIAFLERRYLSKKTLVSSSLLLN